MKIIKSGKIFQINCECGCKFEYVSKDVKQQCVNCPECGKNYCHNNEWNIENSSKKDKKLLFD